MTGFGAINKVVSIFLVGGLSMILLILLFAEPLSKAAEEGQALSAPSMATIGTLSLLGIAALLGATVQGLAGVFVRNPFQILSRHRWFCRIFLEGRTWRELNYWRDHFRTTLGENEACKEYLEEEGQEHAWAHPYPLLAAPIFYMRATPEHLAWVLQHYSTYYLATDVSLILGLTLVLTPFYVAADWLSIFGGRSVFMVLVAACLYATVALALHRYLYTYISALRHACLLELSEE